MKDNKNEKLLRSRLRRQINIQEKYKLRVVDIQFGYDNHKLIDLLKNRGQSIVGLKYDKVKECE